MYFKPLVQADVDHLGITIPEGFQIQGFGFSCGHSPYPGGWSCFLTVDGEVSVISPRGTGITLQAAIDNAAQLQRQKVTITAQFTAAREADARRAAEIRNITLADLGL